MQRYIVYPKIIHLLWLLLAGLMVCCHDDRAMKADGFALEVMEGFILQEQAFARAIHDRDTVGAALALDSMQTLVGHFYEIAHLFPWPQKDSAYFLHIGTLMNNLEHVSDKIYPEVWQYAFLPRNEYTQTREAHLKALLQRADSLIGEPLKELKTLRQATFPP